MRAVVDTSVLVRAAIKPGGTVAPVFDWLRSGAYTLVYSQPLLEEFAEVLSRPRSRRKYPLILRQHVPDR